MYGYRISIVIFILAASASLQSSSMHKDHHGMGTSIVISKADKRKAGQQFTFANLRTPRPFVIYPSGNGTETTKVFEDDETIVLIFVAQLTGSTETFYLNKKRNPFTLIEIGALEATATGTDCRPDITYGALK